MKAELICVGSELVSGSIVNTNASYIAKKLRELGHDSLRQFTVDDNKARLGSLVKDSLKVCDILIISGGLGPTDDDITREAVCETLALKLTENQKCKAHIENYFELLGITPTPNNFKQALAPEGAIIFPNERGTACGIGIELDDKKIILLPGPPKELTYMFEAYIIPYLKRLDRRAVVTHTLNVFGMGESAIDTIIRPFCAADNPVVATYCQDNECSVAATAFADTEEKADRICTEVLSKIKALLGDVVYGEDSDGLACEAVNLLRNAGLKVATAESCTGGMLSEALTSVPHASEAVEIGILAYSNRIKNEALSVPLDVLEEEGAISAETAMYLAKNVRILSDADIGIGITGNAGPTASENKPVGLVFVSIADKTKYYIKRLELPSSYSREKIRSYATLTALDLIRRYVVARPYSLEGMVGFDEELSFNETVSIAESLPTTNESFAVFEVDENIDFENDSGALPATEPQEVVLDINSFITSTDNEKRELLKTVGKLFRRNWVKIVSIAVLLALLISSSILVNTFVHESRQGALLNLAREEFDMTSQDKYEDKNIYCAFDGLIEDNPDIKGWILIDGTEINNPVYQASDNKYYQSHNMVKEKSPYGALFFDYGNTITKDNTSRNLTIYGHNTTNGSMFGNLDAYHSLSFYKNNPIIKLKTLYGQSDYLIFAVIITNADPDDDNGSIYNYAVSDFEGEDDFTAFISEAKKRSLISTDIEVGANDQLLTLSTRSDEFGNARFVVMAKKVSSFDEIGLASKAILNPNTKYPQAWYDKNDLTGYEEKTNNMSSSEPSSSNPSSSESSSSEESSIPSSSELASSEEPPEVKPSSSQTSTPSTPAVCSHTPSSEFTNKDDRNHTYKCTKCGVAVDEVHSFTLEKVADTFLDSSATCTAPASYYKSCKCGKVGTDVFQSGNALEHTAIDVFQYDEQKHWNTCGNDGCDAKLNQEDHSDADDDGKCVCGKEIATP